MTDTTPFTETQHSPARGTRSSTIVWLVLSAVTTISWFLAPGHTGASADPSTLITLVAVVLGAVKVGLIIDSFMEVHSAPNWLRLSAHGWNAALWIAVMVLYLW